MQRYILDTNTVSFIIRNHPVVIQHMVSIPPSSVFISAITEGELRFGLEKRPEAKRLFMAVQEFLRCVDILPWSSSVAQTYAAVRAKMENNGSVLSSLDMLIAAHAINVEYILVSNDKAFIQVPNLKLEDWTV